VLKIVVAGQKREHGGNVGRADMDQTPFDAGVGLMTVNVDRASELHACVIDEETDVIPTTLTVRRIAHCSGERA
jgi:hypothetical protein